MVEQSADTDSDSDTEVDTEADSDSSDGSDSDNSGFFDRPAVPAETLADYHCNCFWAFEGQNRPKHSARNLGLAEAGTCREGGLVHCTGRTPSPLVEYPSTSVCVPSLSSRSTQLSNCLQREKMS